MMRPGAATLAACMLLELLVPAARANAQAAEPFQVVPIEAPVRHSHTWSHLMLAGGAGLVAVSFAFAHRADDTYAEYLVSTDPVAIDALYDRTIRNDHLSQVSLLGGEALIAAGLYVRFVRRPPGARFSLSLDATRCAVSCRF